MKMIPFDMFKTDFLYGAPNEWDASYKPNDQFVMVQNDLGSFREFWYPDPALSDWIEKLSPGVLYPAQYQESYDDLSDLSFYVVDADHQWETTLQVVGKTGKNIVVAQDLEPDPAVHFDYVPHYLIYPSDMFRIITTLDITQGRFHGTFKFHNRGKKKSLGLA